MNGRNRNRNRMASQWIGRMMVVTAVIAALLIGPTMAQEPPRAPQSEPAEMTVAGLLHRGNPFEPRHLPPPPGGEEAVTWFLFTLEHEWLQLRLSGELSASIAELAHQAVTVTGHWYRQERGSFLGAPSFTAHTIVAKPDGISCTIEGVLHEPQTGFDSGALGWHIVAANGKKYELQAADHNVLARFTSHRVRVAARVAFGNRFYENSGHHTDIDYHVQSITRASARHRGLLYADTDSPRRPGPRANDPIWSLMRPLQARSLLLDVTAIRAEADALRGKAVEIEGAPNASGVFVVTQIRELPDGITITFEGILHEPEVGFDSSAKGWHIITSAGNAIEFAPEPPNFNLQPLVGQRIRIVATAYIKHNFYERLGHHVAVVGYRATTITRIAD